MFLSIIISSYRDVQFLKIFFNSFLKQSDRFKKNFSVELIVVLDSAIKEEIAFLEKYRKIIEKIKIIISKKRLGRSECNDLGLKIATGEYFIFLSSTDSLKSNFLYEISNIIKKNKPDLIEFQISFEGLITWTTSQRNVFKNLEADKISYLIIETLPFESNKVWNRAFFCKHREKTEKIFNSRFTLENLYFLLPKINSFVLSNKVLIINFIEKNSYFVSLPIVRFWSEILTFYKNKFPELWNEIFYAFQYHILIFIMRFTLATKNDLLIDKQKKEVFWLSNKYEKHKNNNFYFRFKNKEVETLKKLSVSVKYWNTMRKAL